MKKEEFVRKTKDLALSFKLLGSKIRHFNLTKHLLEKEEKSLRDSVEMKEGLIEFYQNQIEAMKKVIEDYGNAIIEEQKAIKGLNADIKKVVKVINLYIKD